jgi:hypothetical protein
MTRLSANFIPAFKAENSRGQRTFKDATPSRFALDFSTIRRGL